MGSTATDTTSETTTSAASSDPTGGVETTVGVGPFDPKILYIAGGAGPEARASWMNLDGSDATPITSGSSAESRAIWSRNGAYVLLNRSKDIWRVIPETGEELNLTHGGGHSIVVDASPDGLWVLFSGDREPGLGLYRVPIYGGDAEVIALTDDINVQGFEARYSPDSHKIAYTVYGSAAEYPLYIADEFGKGVIEVHGIDASGAPTWSPDGAQVAVHASLGPEESAVFRVDATGAGLTRITSSLVASYPRWSPDGSRIAFYGSDDAKGDHRHYVGVVDPDGENQRLLSFASCYLPDWSPDGKSLVVGCLDEDPPTGIYIVDVESGAPTMLLADLNLSWTPLWRP
ncbi:MAG: hypothetical protein R3B09_33880 [Nannocystaceae bacterium]